VVAIELDEKFERLLDLIFRGLLAERAPDEHGRPVADVRSHGLVGERVHTHVGARGIDGVDEILLGIDESAVEIEDEEVHVSG
jgi:hypothetical protein